jgi:hypothetical protein
MNPEGRQQHLSGQSDEHHDEEQAQFVTGHRHKKARAIQSHKSRQRCTAQKLLPMQNTRTDENSN